MIHCSRVTRDHAPACAAPAPAASIDPARAGDASLRAGPRRRVASGSAVQGSSGAANASSSCRSPLQRGAPRRYCRVAAPGGGAAPAGEAPETGDDLPRCEPAARTVAPREGSLAKRTAPSGGWPAAFCEAPSADEEAAAGVRAAGRSPIGSRLSSAMGGADACGARVAAGPVGARVVAPPPVVAASVSAASRPLPDAPLT